MTAEVFEFTTTNCRLHSDENTQKMEAFNAIVSISFV